MTLLQEFNASLIKWPPPGNEDAVKGIFSLILQDVLAASDFWWKQMDDASKEEFLQTRIKSAREELHKNHLL